MTIFRLQTLLLIVAVIVLTLTLALPLGSIVSLNDGMVEAKLFNLVAVTTEGQYSFKSWYFFADLCLADITALIAIFIYQKERLLTQAMLCIVSIVLVLCWYVLIAIFPNGLGARVDYDLWIALPMIAVVALFFARKRILADRKTLRSYDRIR